MPALPAPATNRLFQALPQDVRARLWPCLEAVAYKLGDVVYEPQERLRHLCFPTDCVVSLVYTMEDGQTAETGLVGNEGVVGIGLFMGGETMPNRAVVQVAGGALWLPAEVLRDEFRRGGAMQLALLRYTQALIAQISQTAVCNRMHPVEKRLSRWLLLTHDRVAMDELRMTQDFISHMLGVRREAVAAAGAHLQEAGLIRYARGNIRILDRPGLEAASCECYPVVRDEFARLLDR